MELGNCLIKIFYLKKYFIADKQLGIRLIITEIVKQRIIKTLNNKEHNLQDNEIYILHF